MTDTWFPPVFVVTTLLLGLFAVTTGRPPESVRLVDAGVRVEQLGTRFVTGTLQNLTDRSYAQLSLEIHVLDGNGEILHSFAEHTGQLPAGGTWDIEVPVLAENAVSYRLDSLRCKPASGSVSLRRGRCRLLHEGSIE